MIRKLMKRLMKVPIVALTKVRVFGGSCAIDGGPGSSPGRRVPICRPDESQGLVNVRMFLAGFAILFMLSACGFKPVYGERYDGDIELSLSEIKLGTLGCKRGYKLKNYIEDQLDPHQLLSYKKYTLDVNIVDSISDLLVQQDSTITKRQHNVSAEYALRDNATNTVIDKGNINIAVSYSELPSEYATYAIGERSYDNALKEVAVELKKHLVTALSQYQEDKFDENQPS